VELTVKLTAIFMDLMILRMICEFSGRNGRYSAVLVEVERFSGRFGRYLGRLG
jgi:hypothetical protein